MASKQYPAPNSQGSAACRVQAEVVTRPRALDHPHLAVSAHIVGDGLHIPKAAGAYPIF